MPSHYYELCKVKNTPWGGGEDRDWDNKKRAALWESYLQYCSKDSFGAFKFKFTRQIDKDANSDRYSRRVESI